MNIRKRYDDVLGETLYQLVHPSGLEIQYLPKPGFSKKYAYFTTRYGALYNQFETATGEVYEMPPGIAHFLEHKIFEEDEQDIFESFAKLGASVNAFTNFTSTAYMFSTIDHFYQGLELLMGFVQNCHLTDENVEKEKGIIAQEIMMYDDDPDWRVYFNTLKAMYHKHPVRQDVAGTKESVNRTTREQLQLCFDHFYAPANMLLFIVGDLDIDEIAKVVESALKPEYLQRTATPRLVLPKEPAGVHRKEMIETMDVPVPIFHIGMKEDKPAVKPQERLKHTIALKLAIDIEFGKGSTFYKTCYEEGIINASFFSEYSSGYGYAHTMFGGESQHYREIQRRLMEEIKRVRTEGIDRDAFMRIKRKAIGRYLSAFNSVQYIASAFVGYKVKGLDLFDYLPLLKEITPEYAEKVFREHFNADHLVLSVVE